MSRNALAFISGLGTGYVEQQEKNKAQERQAKIDAQNTEQHDARMQDYKDVQAKKKAIANAYAPITVEQGAGGMLKPETMDNRDVGLPENASMASQGLSPQAFRVAGKDYGTEAEAGAAAATYNAPEASNKRAAMALRGVGDHQGAMKLESDITSQKANELTLTAKTQEEAHKLRTEGVFAALPFMRSGDVQGMVAELNSGGTMKIVSDVQKTEEVRDIPGVGKIPTYNYSFNIQGPDGKIIPRNINSHDISVQMMPYKEYMGVAQQGLAAGRADKADNRAERTLQLNEQTTAQSMKVSELAYAKALEDNKVPSAVKMQAENASAELKTIGTAIAKAQAEGSWNLDSPGSKQLLERQGVLNLKMQSLLSPYAPKAGAGANADPINMRGGKPGSAKMAPISYKDPVWEGAEASAAQKTGVPLEYLKSIRVNGERSNGEQVSPKGAQGVYQFIPSTRDAFKQKYGVDAYSSDPNEQALAAAYHLKESQERTGSWDKAVAGYNGGISGEQGTNTTQENKNYTSRVVNGVQPVAIPQVQGASVSTPQATAPVTVARPNIGPAKAQPASLKPIEAVAIALGMTGKNSNMDQVIRAKLPAFDAAMQGMSTAKTQLAATAKSGDVQALQAYTQQYQVAKANFDTLLKDMNPQMADQIRQAAGYFQ